MTNIEVNMVYLITIYVILFFFLAWRRLDWAVMILIAALPSYLIRFKILGLPLTLLEVMIWLVFLAWLGRNYQMIIGNLKLKIYNSFKIKNLKFKISSRYPFDWEIVLLLMVSLAAVAVGGFTTSAFGIWKAYFFEPALLFIVVINLISAQARAGGLAGKNFSLPAFIKGAELILRPLAVSALAVSLVAIYQELTGALIGNPVWAAAEARRVVSFFGYPNAVGLYLGPIIVVLVGWLITIIRINSKPETNFQFPISKQIQNNKSKIKASFLGLVIIISLLSVYFAHSKGAMLGVAAGLAVFGLSAGKKIRLATLAAIALLAISVAVYQPARSLAVENITLVNLSGQIRKAGWSDAWRMLKDGRLISGAGLANYQVAVAPYHTEGIFIKDYKDPDFQRKLVFNQAYRAAHWQPLEIYLYPHSIVLNFWSELGLAGLLLFVWIIIKYFVMGIWNLFGNLGIAKSRYLVIGLICAMVVILVHGVVDAPYFKNDLAAMFWLLLAMMGLIQTAPLIKGLPVRQAGDRGIL
jgi:hypothetical protein